LKVSLLFCVSLLLVSCSNPETDSEESLSSLQTNSSFGPERKIIESDGLSENKPASISTVNVISDKKLEIFFDMGPEDCFGFESSVKESETEIVLSVTTGALVEAESADCDLEEIITNVTEVNLEKPVAGRTIKTN